MINISSMRGIKVKNKMKPDFFISDDGNLYDCNRNEWYMHPVRKNYEKTHRNIESANDFKATLRAGEYAWPGGYRMGFVTSDGGFLCFKCARENAREIINAIKYDWCWSDGWKVTNTDIIYDGEDIDIYCSHCSKTF